MRKFQGEIKYFGRNSDRNNIEKTSLNINKCIQQTDDVKLEDYPSLNIHTHLPPDHIYIHESFTIYRIQ